MVMLPDEKKYNILTCSICMCAASDDDTIMKYTEEYLLIFKSLGLECVLH